MSIAEARSPSQDPQTTSFVLTLGLTLTDAWANRLCSEPCEWAVLTMQIIVHRWVLTCGTLLEVLGALWAHIPTDLGQTARNFFSERHRPSPWMCCKCFRKARHTFDPNPERTRPSTEGDKNADVLGGRFLQLACIVSNERMEEQAEGSALPSRWSLPLVCSSATNATVTSAANPTLIILHPQSTVSTRSGDSCCGCSPDLDALPPPFTPAPCTCWWRKQTTLQSGSPAPITKKKKKTAWSLTRETFFLSSFRLGRGCVG